MKTVKFLAKWIPLSAILFVIIIAITQTGYVFHGVWKEAFYVFGAAVLGIEFFKSADTNWRHFLYDIAIAVLLVSLLSAYMTYLWIYDFELEFFHWYCYGLFMVDAILSPTNSFRMAMRNFGVTPNSLG